MEGKDCVKLFKKLSFDKPTMETKLAEAYLSKPTPSGDSERRKDSLSNTMKILAADKVIGNPVTGNVLNKIASLIDENADLISQIEYHVRGITLENTKGFDIAQMAKYFRYYAQYADLRDIFWKDRPTQSNVCFKRITNSSPLVSFAWICASAFAAQKVVLLHVETDVLAVCVLLEELCIQAGISCDMIHIKAVIKCEDKESCDYKYSSNIGGVMTVYKSSDLDSAVDAVITAAWSHKGLLPWALKRILVQESAYDIFLSKLSDKLKSFQWNLPEDYKADGTSLSMINRVESIYKMATQQNISFVPMHPSFETEGCQKLFKPLVLIDNISPNFWDNLYNESFPTPVVTLQSFRTTKEAVSLISAVPSCALSLWCANSSIANEMTLLTNVDCIWINTYITMDPYLPMQFKHLKYADYYGGKQGFLKHMLEREGGYFDKVDGVSSSTFTGYVEKAMKLQNVWCQTTKENKVNTIIKIAKHLEAEIEKYVNLQMSHGLLEGPARESIQNAISFTYRAALMCEESGNDCIANSDKRISLNVMKPLGIINITDVSLKAILLEYDIYRIISAGLYGNTVIFKSITRGAMELCTQLSNLGWPVVINITNISGQSALEHYEMLSGLWLLYDVKDDASTIPNKSRTTDRSFWSDRLIDLKDIVKNKDLLKMRFTNNKIISNTYGETFAN